WRRWRYQPRCKLPLGQGLRKDQRQQDQKAHQSKLHDSRDQTSPFLVGLDSASGFHQAVFKHASSPIGDSSIVIWTPAPLKLLPKTRKFSAYTLTRTLPLLPCAGRAIAPAPERRARHSV